MLEISAAAASMLQISTESSTDSYIINGTMVTNISQRYSFYAMPPRGRNTNEWLGCGASIISPTFGMTAAHCFGGGQSPCSGPAEVGLWLGDVERSAKNHVSGIVGGR